MIAFRRSLNSWPRIAQLAMFVMTLTTVLTIASHAQNQNPAQDQQPASQQPPSTTPQALFEDSTLTGTTDTINVNWLPVVKGDGSIVYDDVVIKFDVAADGTLTVSSLQQTPVPKTLDDGFMAGEYSQSAGGGPNLQVSGPGIAPNGATVWALSLVQGSYCVNPNIATWYDVGTKIKNSPIYARLKAAGINSTKYYQFGVGSGCSDNNPWAQNTLIGFSQAGNGLAISSVGVEKVTVISG